MKKLLFQGDCITDYERRDDLGMGYPLLIASQLGYESPGEYSFINKGVERKRIIDLYATIKSDIINLQPDCVSILIGATDVLYDIEYNNGIKAEKYEKLYCMLIEELQQALPGTDIIILEPFCLKGSATNDKWELYDTEIRKRAEKARAVAAKYGVPFIPLQERFDQLSQKSGTDYWLFDGINPTVNGHEVLKRAWISTYKEEVCK